MTARTIVITGASDGIGASAARTLSKQGERVVVVGRSAEKTERIAEEIGADYFVSDFADLAQVRQLAAQLKEKYPRIDVLANNAGGIMGSRELTVDGHEKTFQINHLAPFLLTTELMDVLTASQATVINTSSAANCFGKLDLDDLETAAQVLHQPGLRQRQAGEHPLHRRAATTATRPPGSRRQPSTPASWPPTSRRNPPARSVRRTGLSSTGSC